MIELTNREWQIVRLVKRGWAAKRIASALPKENGSPLSVKTVNNYVNQIAARLPNPEGTSARIRIILWAQSTSTAAA